MIAVVTGPDMYNFIQVHDGAFNNATIKVDSLATESCDVEPVAGRNYTSTNYTTHCWSLDTQNLIVGTDLGDVLQVGYDGKLKAYIPESPRGY
jgi:hypothetical protein